MGLHEQTQRGRAVLGRARASAGAVGLALCLGGLCGLCACAGNAPVPERAAAMGGATPKGRCRCRYLRIEQREEDSQAGADSVAMTLVITPPGQTGAQDVEPVSAKVLVQRERAVGLDAELRAHPDLLCEPEPGRPASYKVQLP